MKMTEDLRHFALAFLTGQQWAEDIVEFIELNLHQEINEFSFSPSCANCARIDGCSDDTKNNRMEVRFCPEFLPIPTSKEASKGTK